MKKIRILLADDHLLMRIGLSTLIASEKDMEVVGEADNGADAVALAETCAPNVIIMDLMMPRMSGAKATQLIRKAHPDIHVLILTSYGNAAELTEAIDNGADGVLLKDTATDTLIAAIRTVKGGGKAIPESLLRRTNTEPPPANLTERQLMILESVTRGLTNPEIATQLGISEIGVKKHLQVIFAKIGAATRAEAASIALRKQLLKI